MYKFRIPYRLELPMRVQLVCWIGTAGLVRRRSENRPLDHQHACPHPTTPKPFITGLDVRPSACTENHWRSSGVGGGGSGGAVPPVSPVRVGEGSFRATMTCKILMTDQVNGDDGEDVQRKGLRNFGDVTVTSGFEENAAYLGVCKRCSKDT